MDIVCMGELVADLLPAGLSEEGFPLLELNPGGAPANVAAAVAAFGGASAFVGKVGLDGTGRMLSQMLRGRSVNTDCLIGDASCETGVAMVSLDENGERSFQLFVEHPADLKLTAQELERRGFHEFVEGCRVFHFGARSLSSAVSREAAIYAAETAKRRGARIAFDPNLRPALWASDDEARRDCLAGIGQADLIKLSFEEMEFCFGTRDIGDVLNRLSADGKEAVVTVGAEGAYALADGGLLHVPAFDVRAVDTTGAGDAFWGAWLFAMTREKPYGAADRLRLGCAAGALTTQKKGAMKALPCWDDVLTLAFGRKDK